MTARIWSRKVEWMPIAAIVAIGLLLRIIGLAEHSLLFDEALVGVTARDIYRNHTPMWDAVSNAPFVWWLAMFERLFGDTPFLLRLPSAIAGGLSIWAVYLLGQRLFTRGVALAGALVLALHPFAVAFTRVAFADPYQTFFLILVWLVGDHLAVNRWRDARSDWRRLLAVTALAGLSFLMKYNAVVPEAVWFVAGVLAGRYYWSTVLWLGVVFFLGSILTLLPWPYDAPVWLLAFAEKGGSYSVAFASQFYLRHLFRLFLGAGVLTLAGALYFGYTGRDPESRSIAQLLLFVLGYTTILVFLGRTFQRYLLIECVAVSMMLAVVVQRLWRSAKGLRSRWPGLVVRALALVILLLAAGGALRTYRFYVAYLHNDIDERAFASQVLQLEQEGGRRGYWLMPEIVGAYYLGLSQRYSRAIRPNLDGRPAAINYFEWRAVPFSGERETYRVFEARALLRRWGFVKALRYRADFVKAVKDSTAAHNRSVNGSAINYLVDSTIRPGDLLLMQGGFRDLQGEPILEDITHAEGPPLLHELPLEKYRLLAAYRPADETRASDTTIDRVRAGGWILVRK